MRPWMSAVGQEEADSALHASLLGFPDRVANFPNWEISGGFWGGAEPGKGGLLEREV